MDLIKYDTKSLSTKEGIAETALSIQSADVELSAQGKYPTIYNQKKEVGVGLTTTLIAKVVEVGIKPIMAKSKLSTPEDFFLFATDFIDKHPTESIEDLALCLKRARQGTYGDIYNRVDGLVIFDWFAKFLHEKLEKKERYIHQAKISRSNELNEGLSSEGLKVCESIRERIKIAEKEKKQTQLQPNKRKSRILELFEKRKDMNKNQIEDLIKDMELSGDYYAKEIKQLKSIK